MGVIELSNRIYSTNEDLDAPVGKIILIVPFLHCRIIVPKSDVEMLGHSIFFTVY